MTHVETVLEFAEHVVLNARRMWNEFPLQHRRRMQKILFPEGLIFEGEAFRTPATCLFFRDSAGTETGRFKATEFELEKVVAHPVPSWNRIGVWLKELNHLGGRQCGRHDLDSQSY